MVQIHLEARNVFTAREDPTSPSQIRNERKTLGYVGQAARPPGFGAMGYGFHVDADEPEDRSRRYQ